MRIADKWLVAGLTLLAMMCIVWIWYGWHIIFEGGFYSRPRGSEVTTHVDGLAATFMAFIFFSLAAICSAIIMNRFNLPRVVSTAVAVTILGLPVAFLLVKQFRNTV